MNRKSKTLFYSFFIMTALLCVEVFYLYSAKGIGEESIKNKREFVKLTALTDLAISTETSYIRHKSVSDFFSIYRDDGVLREYFASTFVFSNACERDNEK